MLQKNPFVRTTITTIIAVIIFLLVTFLRTGKLDFVGLTIFAVVFWIFFFSVQYLFSKKQ
jgi:Zn-dependent protease with chaperone function